MKISAILVSLSLPLAAQSAAQAAEDQGTVEFLKASLSPTKALVPARAQKSKIILSALTPQAAQTKPAYGVKLRPFVPNRKLPSRRDLEMELLSQTPRMAPAQQSSLSGQISEFGMQSMSSMPRAYDSNVSTYDQATLNRYSSVPRLSTLQVIATPGQVRVNRQAHHAGHTPFQPQVAHAAQTAADWLGQPRAGERMIRQGGALLAQAPAAIPSESRLADLGYPSAEELATPAAPLPSQSGSDIIRPQQVESQLGPGPGPAPFPLSLLPQDELKSLIKSRVKNKVQAPPAYFGSWHGPQQGSSLPPGGFQTHMQSRGFGAPHAGAYQTAHYLAKPAAKHSAPGQASMMQASMAKPHPELKIAVYPPYSHQPPTAQ